MNPKTLKSSHLYQFLQIPGLNHFQHNTVKEWSQETQRVKSKDLYFLQNFW